MSHLPNIVHLQSIDVEENGRLKTKEIGADNKPVLCMIYASYCGFCTKAAPAFQEVHNLNRQKKVFLCAIQTDDKDVSVQKLMKYFPQILKNNGVQFNGVPTYVLYKNGKWSEYKGGRDKSALQSFINSL